MKNFNGLIAAPFTPFREDGSLNLDKIEEQVELLLAHNIRGVFVGGTTGESMSLSIRERLSIAERWVETSPEDFKVIIHSGHTTLSDCIRIAKHAQKIGAYGTGAMGPFFYRPETVDDLVVFTKKVAQAASELPFYYYHLPSMTGIDFPMLDYLEAASGKIPNLAGIKYTDEDLMDFKLCEMHEGGRYELLHGRDEILLCGLSLGVNAAVGSTYNYMAPLYNNLIEAWKKDEIGKARDLQYKAMRFVKILQKYGGSIVAGKAVMKITGINCGPVRSPLRNLTDQQVKQMEEELKEIGFFEFSANLNFS